jgi:type II secretory pathway pseudopilin PulG
VNFHSECISNKRRTAAFTLIEALVGIAVLGIGVASTIGALTKFNTVAASARNATGAYTAVMNQIDLIESLTPFNPQKKNDTEDCDGVIHNQDPQVPVDRCNNPGTFDLTLGRHTYNNIPVYQDPNTGVVVVGTMTVDVASNSGGSPAAVPSLPANTYQFTVTLTYDYLDHRKTNNPPNPYTFSMTTIRASDI